LILSVLRICHGTTLFILFVHSKD